MALSTKRKDGRRYAIDSSGVRTLKRRYQVVMDDMMDAELASFPGVPAIGSAHPAVPGLYVDSYDVEEGEGAAKKTLAVTANYERTTIATESGAVPAEDVDYAIEEWGWDSATDQKELVTAADGTPILNSAGDPFDSVPSISVYAPVFTKVMKFAARQSGAMAHNCKTNAAAVTIGGTSYPANSLLCAVAEARIYGNATWKYRYTVHLKYKTNLVKLARSNTATDIGWDVAITDAGMRQKRATSSKSELITVLDPETGESRVVTSPELLDGNGLAVDRSAGTPVPYNFRFKAYETTTFPNWFYSED